MIKGLSETRRLPRLGKIRLGVRHPEKGYPMKTDYFVCPDEVKKIYGPTPRSLEILIPVEDMEKWCPQYYKCYSKTQGLICKGDGETAWRTIDTTTGALANRNTKAVERREISCDGPKCLDFLNKQCKPVMSLQFLLYRVPGLGIYQIDTSSINSIININSCADYIRAIMGRVSMIPLHLTMEPKEVQEPESGKRQTVYVLNLRNAMALIEMSKFTRDFQAQIGIGGLALPAPDESTVDEVDMVEDDAEVAPVPANTNGDGHHEATVEAERDIEFLWESAEAPNPMALITESKATDIKSLIEERKCVAPVKDYMVKKFGKLIALRQLTNEQADALIKYINTIKS